ncbi:MAG: ribonuclease P protein component [Porphyromonas sp.]|nr:ribonuclease P protein component [Porphyromonas sp.]
MGKMYTLQKYERLFLREDLKNLFEQRQAFVAYPFRVVYSIQEITLEESNLVFPNAALVINVAKKRIRKAVDRNRIKRCCREAYRVRKLPLVEVLQQKALVLHFAWQFIGKEIPSYEQIEKVADKTLKRLCQEVEGYSDQTSSLLDCPSSEPRR